MRGIRSSSQSTAGVNVTRRAPVFPSLISSSPRGAVDVLPTKVQDLALPASGEQQQADRRDRRREHREVGLRLIQHPAEAPPFLRGENPFAAALPVHADKPAWVPPGRDHPPGHPEGEHLRQHAHHLVCLVRPVAKCVVQRPDMRPLQRRRRNIAELRKDVRVHEPLEGLLRRRPAIHRDMCLEIAFGEVGHRRLRPGDRIEAPLDPIDDDPGLLPGPFRGDLDMGADGHLFAHPVGPTRPNEVNLPSRAIDAYPEADQLLVLEHEVGAVFDTERGALIDCPLPEIFYGGARGGGKTDGIIGKYAIKGEQYGAAFNAIFFRRELPMADDAIERSQEILGGLGWTYNAAKYQWRSPAGARLRFRPLERVTDAEKYQGQNLTDAAVEEAGNYPDPKPIDRLNGVLRSAKGVPTQLCLTGNPGGPGQQWIKRRYIDPAPGGLRVLGRTLPNGKQHKFVFIPSKLENNRALLTADPDYINRLYLVGSDQLVKAWLEGDWSAIEGAFFDCWSSERHVIEPFSIPEHWHRFRAGDWGSAAPFSFGWYAVVDGEFPGLPEGHPARTLVRGCLVRYREWYGEGKKLTAEEVADGIKEREAGDANLTYGVLDPSAFAMDGGPSIAERMAGKGVRWRPADNKRVTQRGAMGGWDQMRARLKGNAEGQPMLVFFFDLHQRDQNDPGSAARSG